MNFENHCKICQRNVHCCIFKKKEGFAFVSIKNAEEIKQKTGKKYTEFLDYSPLPKKIVDAMQHEDFYLEGAMRIKLLDQNNRLLRLKIKENEHCIFLNDKRRCAIYNIRPHICRIYPFWTIKLLSGKLKVIKHDENPKCGIIKELQKMSGDKTDFEKALKNKQVKEIKEIMKNIEKENIHYKKNIDQFVKINHLKN
jgi:Fe-S-cluster containining protein